MSEAILLRTLARKSVLDFGKHKDRSVQQILDLKNYRALRWYYYNYSMISFLPDILEEIGVTEEWRIPKPGKNPEMNEKLNALKDQNARCFLGRLMEDDEREAYKQGSIAKKRHKRNAGNRFGQFKHKDSKEFSKANMAWKNQGH